MPGQKGVRCYINKEVEFHNLPFFDESRRFIKTVSVATAHDAVANIVGRAVGKNINEFHRKVGVFCGC